MNRHVVRLAVTTAALAMLPWAGHVASAQSKSKANQSVISQKSVTVTDSAGRKHTRMLPFTQAERQAAAERLKAKRQAAAEQAKLLATAAIGTPLEATTQAYAAVMALAAGPIPMEEMIMGANGELVPDYSGMTANYAYSPVPDFSGTDPNCVAPNYCGIRKFVDGLPGLTAAGANGLGQYIPIAIADTTTYPGSDYYEIELGQYTQKMHTDLEPTTLRGYRQTNTGDPTVSVFSYLGPLIIAQKGRPVRIKFTNNLPTGAGGNLFIPVDTSVMGAGPGPNHTGGGDPEVVCKKDGGGLIPAACFTENRATIHLHGGVTPWISDGTTHQWITPANEATAYPKGVSVYNVPDMPNPGKPPVGAPDPSAGVQTFYYTNNQSARLMFYHDHAHGITRLNVYVGVAAGYLLTDPTEQRLLTAGLIPSEQIPLVIQDKTFVDPRTIRVQDPTWNWGTGTTFTTYTNPVTLASYQLRDAKRGDLWWPHVYMPAQNPYDISGTNAMGRWHFGPWFWPPTTGIQYLPVPNPYYDCNAQGLPDATHPCTRPWQTLDMPAAPNPSWGAEAFLDTPVINGTAYPVLTVEPKAYRFRILNAAHDRFWNLHIYQADPTIIDPADPGYQKEIKMVPATPGNPTFPALWPTDGRVGGVPDPTLKGPEWVQLGTEGGFLPMPVVVPHQPIVWNANPTTFNFGNVSDHSLLLGPAERADVVVDFTAFAGQTLILYNDAPAAFPALDPRNDPFTGAPSTADTGGPETTFAGFGPNIRTIMQIKVGNTVSTPSTFDLTALRTAWAPVMDNSTTPPTKVSAGVFEEAQDPIVVGQTAYNEAYGMTFPQYFPNWGYARIQDFAMSFMTTLGNITRLNFENKAIHDEMGAAFDEYGRMAAKLGLELPNTNNMNQLFVLQGFNDPPTELIKLSDIGTPIGTAEDGTQIWKITHNGVDTHPIHFHLFHVQLINRVGWDGAIRLPDATELGWKDTLRISPLEDTIVALRPIVPRPDSLPWKLPNSYRPLNPAVPLGSSLGFTGLDPLGNVVAVTNEVTNFGWEYIWHCHILSHEENDMMRAVVFATPPEAPTQLAANVVGTGNQRTAELTWLDNSLTESTFVVQRAADPGFTLGLQNFTIAANATENDVETYSDRIRRLPGPFYYRVFASNTAGSTVQGYSQITANSTFSNVVGPPGGATTLDSIVLDTVVDPRRPPVVISWTYTGTDVPTGFTIQRATTPDFITGSVVFNVGDVRTFSDDSVKSLVTYYYRVAAANGLGNGTFSNTLSITTP